MSEHDKINGNDINIDDIIANTNQVTSVHSRKPREDSKGETECRRALESIFGKSFAKQRPAFLNNDVTYQNLELDCYNDELKIACEYQGEGHYKYIPYFHKTIDAFRNQQYRDYMKAQKCKENGIKLIIVPCSIPVHDIEQYIKNFLERNER